MAYNKYQMSKQNQEDTFALQKNTANAVRKMLFANKEKIINSMPQGFNFDRMCRAILFSINSNYELAKCSPVSLFTSTVRGFLMGLEPNGPLGEGYLVPFWSTKKSCNEAQFIPGYRGLQNLARRSGEVTECYAKIVMANDIFEVEEGTERKIVHKPNYAKDRGAPMCAYAVFRTKLGSVDFEVMGMDEIETIRKRSKAGESGPWQTDYIEMAKKTVVRRLMKRAPMSIEFSRAVEYDNKSAMGDFDGANAIIDLDGFDLSDGDTPADIQGQLNANRTAELRNQIKNANTRQGSANNDFGVMIQQELTKSGNPLTKEQVLAYVDKEGIVLTMDMDFHDLCEKAAAKSDSLL